MQTDQVRVVDAEALARSLDQQGRITVENILFESTRADLLPDSDTALTEIARLLEARPEIGLYVVGHTDSTGGLEANMALSHTHTHARAAAAIASALEARFGIAPGRIIPAGAGPVAPVASNATEAGRAQNRRVEIVLRQSPRAGSARKVIAKTHPNPLAFPPAPRYLPLLRSERSAAW